MFDLDKIKEAIEDLSESDKVAMWNRYCENNNYWDERIEYNNPNDLMYGLEPEEVIRRIDKEGNYSLSDDYCVIDSSGEYVSFDHVDDDNSPFDIDELANYVYDNEDAMGYLDEDDISLNFNYNSFVDNEMSNDDIEQFLISNDVSFDEDDDEITRADLVKDYLEDLNNDTDEITESLSDLGWLFDIEERVSQYFK